MTREEAIETIKYILKVIPKEPPTECDNIEEWLCEDDEIRKALDIAIKSLEQTIDKEKMIEELEESLQKANATNAKLILLVDGKQKPCEDAVSRRAVLDTLDKMDSVLDEDRTVETYKELLATCYNGLPPVTPVCKQKWIPVSERLPKPYTYVNATCRSLVDDRENWVVETMYLPIPKENDEQGYSDWGNIPMLNLGKAEVIAWMERKIPEPYKADNRTE